MLKEGTRAEIDGTPPVKDGEEVGLKIAEPHQFNLSDGVARVGGYPVVVGGGISYVGQEHKVRIERAGRTTAYATLLDAKPKALEIPQDPAEFEIPEFDREIGERLELRNRSRNRRGRTARTPKKAAEAKPAASRSRAKPAAAEAEAEPTEADAVAEAPVEGDEAAAAKPKRRRGTRGGRGRTRKPATAATSANGDEPEAAAEPQATEDKPAPSLGGAVHRRSPGRMERRRQQRRCPRPRTATSRRPSPSRGVAPARRSRRRSPPPPPSRRPLRRRRSRSARAGCSADCLVSSGCANGVRNLWHECQRFLTPVGTLPCYDSAARIRGRRFVLE